MAHDLDPVVEQWYRQLEKGQEFKVTNVDEDNELVEIQHYDGDIQEINFDEWLELDLELTETPEDWTAPMDNVEYDDLGYEETDMDDNDWEEPLDEYEEPGDDY